MKPDIHFEGLDELLEAIRDQADQIAYLFLQDRTVPGCDKPVGRFDFDEEAFEPPDEAFGGPTVLEQICDAAESWLLETASDLTVGHAMKRFRVRCMAPKGSAMIHSGQFVARDLSPPEPQPPAPAAALALPEADFSAVEHTGLTRSLHALGELYTRFGNLVLGAVGNLQRIHDSTTTQLHQQLQESRAQTDLLVGSILEARAAELNVTAERQAESQQADTRSALARDAIHQIGEAARALLGQQGLTPDTVELLRLLQTSPKLGSVLKDPAVRALIQQPGQLDQLAAVLEAAARPRPIPPAVPDADPPKNPDQEVPDGPSVR
ncbi:MAG: hypothetical protein KC656_13555 [Myxococcales bacterium]|nr:hypothetical protein [Myxococcales bacterium]